MIVGTPSAVAAQAAPVARDVLTLFDLDIEPLGTDFVVGSVIVLMDGAGVSGAQALQAVVAEKDDEAATVALGDRVLLQHGLPQQWVHLPFDNPPRLRRGAVPLLGVLGGPTGGVARLLGPLTGSGRAWASTFDTADLSGGSTPLTYGLSAVLLGVKPWTPPEITDEEIAALPLHVASGIFDQGGIAGEPITARCGWRYLLDAPPAPATCVARTGGPIAEFVGQRIRVTRETSAGPLSVVLYVDDEQPFEDELAVEDFAIARDGFAALGELWRDTLDVIVEVVA